MSRSGANLAKRVAVAAVGIPIVVGLAYLGGIALALMLGAFAAVAAWELCAMNRVRGVESFPLVAALLALAFPWMAVALSPAALAVWGPIMIAALVAPAVLWAALPARPTVAAALTVFAALYTGGLLTFAVWLRELDHGPGWSGAALLLLPIAVTWVGDTAAYVVGKGIGVRKLAPETSPNKTWAGAVGGFVATVVATYLWVLITDRWVGWTLATSHVLALGALISLAGQVGDLIESRFKRDSGVKDSSNLIPGHGGFLDRVDSLLFAFPVTYAYLSVTGA